MFIVAPFTARSWVTVFEASVVIWRWSPRLSTNAVPLMSAFIVPVPVPLRMTPSLPIAAEFWPIVPPVIVASSVPASLTIETLFSALPVTVSVFIVTVPVSPLASMPCSPTALPLFVTRELVRSSPVSAVVRIPSSPPLLTLTRSRSTPPPTFVRLMPAPFEFWIAPPVQVAAEMQEPPFPVIVRPPADPVVLRTIPLVVAPVESTSWRVAPAAPMSVLTTLSAVPVPVWIVFPPPVTASVPLAVAVIPAPDVVSMSSPPPASVRVCPSLAGHRDRVARCRC